MFRKTILGLLILGAVSVGCKSKRPSISHKDRHKKIERPVASREKKQDRAEQNRNEDMVKMPVPASLPYNERVSNYISTYGDIAKEEMKLYGVPASIKIAQGILESGAGYGELAQRSNNHFGIKCHTGWEGGRVYHDDDEKGECFRKYNHPKYSFRDHSLFLSQRKRYGELFTLRQNDYSAWAHGLKKAGYATDPSYASKLIGIIERYQLHRLDEEVLGLNTNLPATATSLESSGNISYMVQAGDTLYSISKRFGTTVEMIKGMNNLKGDNISVGQVLYLQPSTDLPN